MTITETVLEMHYHRPLMDLIRATYGVGTAGQFNFYKYSPQREVYIGFDQAFAMTELSDGDFFSLLKQSAATASYKLPSRFFAYFLQYKVVAELHRRQTQTPPAIRSKPHYRASLDTTKNDRTGFSQHELLVNLCRNDAALVYYACPMIFDKSELYEVNINWDMLRLVDLTSCPGYFDDNSRHYIYFDRKTSDPIWCSEPVSGTSRTANQFAEQVATQLRLLSPSGSAEKLLSLLAKLRSLRETKIGLELDRSGTALVADSLTIVQVLDTEGDGRVED